MRCHTYLLRGSLLPSTSPTHAHSHIVHSARPVIPFQEIYHPIPRDQSSLKTLVHHSKGLVPNRLCGLHLPPVVVAAVKRGQAAGRQGSSGGAAGAAAAGDGSSNVASQQGGPTAQAGEAASCHCMQCVVQQPMGCCLPPVFSRCCFQCGPGAAHQDTRMS